MSSAYSKTVKTKLSFKGGGANRIVTKKPRDGASSSDYTSSAPAAPGRHAGEEAAAAAEGEGEGEEDFKVIKGTGRISSSGTIVHGHGTRFMSELAAGDAILVVHPTTLQEETKIVRMVVSDSSMGVSSALSSDLITTTEFRYIKAPKDPSAADPQRGAAAAAAREAAREQASVGTYASEGGQKFVFRVKKEGAHGGYKIMTESAGGSKTRHELLDMRSKKKADRHCY